MLAGLQPLQRGQTVQAGHLQVQQQDIGFMLLQHVQHLPAVLRLRHDLEICLQRQQPAQAVAENGVVVRHHDANLRLARWLRLAEALPGCHCFQA